MKILSLLRIFIRYIIKNEIVCRTCAIIILTLFYYNSEITVVFTTELSIFHLTPAISQGQHGNIVSFQTTHYWMMHNQHTFFPVSAHIQTRHNISRIEGSKITIKKSKSGYALGVLEGVGLFVLFEDGYRVLKPNEIEYPRYKPGELVEVRNNFGDSFYQARVVYKKKGPPQQEYLSNFQHILWKSFLDVTFYVLPSTWENQLGQDLLSKKNCSWLGRHFTRRSKTVSNLYRQPKIHNLGFAFFPCGLKVMHFLIFFTFESQLACINNNCNNRRINFLYLIVFTSS